MKKVDINGEIVEITDEEYAEMYPEEAAPEQEPTLEEKVNDIENALVELAALLTEGAG